MSELEKYELVNSCETVKELEEAILKLADEDGMITGRTKKFNAEMMSKKVWLVVNQIEPANRLTRNYGIRQQALYLQYYERN